MERRGAAGGDAGRGRGPRASLPAPQIARKPAPPSKEKSEKMKGGGRRGGPRAFPGRPPSLPFTCGPGGAAEAACARCPPLPAAGPVAPCHWLGAADRHGRPL